MSIAEAFSCTAVTLLGGAFVVITTPPVILRSRMALPAAAIFALGLACFIASAWTAALS